MGYTISHSHRTICVSISFDIIHVGDIGLKSVSIFFDGVTFGIRQLVVFSNTLGKQLNLILVLQIQQMVGVRYPWKS